MTLAAGGGIPLAKLMDTHTLRGSSSLACPEAPLAKKIELAIVLLRQAGGYTGMRPEGSSRGPTTV